MIEAMVTQEAEHYSDESKQKGQMSPRQLFLKWARSCRNSAAAAGAARQAKANRLMRIDLETCDADPMVINCRNGVIDTTTMSFTEHHPDQLLTMRSGVSYDAGALCPAWDAFFEQVQPDPAMR
jgi:putative DNA primase/helicase